MNRFFLPSDAFQPHQVVFPSETANQIVRVLRLQSGQQVIVLDNRGSEYQVALEVSANGTVTGTVLEKHTAAGEAGLQLVIFIGLTQREKFELILQKCTEVGVVGFVPFTSSRSLVQGLDDAVRKTERWNGILREAAEQSGRGVIPRLYPPVKFQQAVRQSKLEMDMGVFAWEGENQTKIGQVLAGIKENSQARKLILGLFIGPEGGFSEDEVELARSEGLLTFSLGRRVLRMETAAVVASTLIFHHFGEM